MIDKLLAILVRDIQSARSYRLSFFFQFIGPVVLLFTFFFIARILESAFLPALDRYGGDYFAFALIGIIFASYVGIAMASTASGIRAYQRSGTLEVLLTTPTGLGTVIFGSSLYSLITRTIFIVLYLFLGATVFGVDLSQANVLTGLAALGLMILVMLGLGML